MTTIALCMIVRDEERNLADCLRSVEGAVDEIVIVDTGSKDETIAIARTFGARVFEQAWIDDFSAARNRAIDEATSDYALILDADERLEPATCARLRDVVAGAKDAAGFVFVTRSLMPAGETARWTDTQSTRLFTRRPEHRYEGAIHEQITPAIVRAGGKVVETDLVLVHHGYLTDAVQGGQSRARRNLSLLEKQAKRAPKDAYVLYNLGCTYKAIGDLASARKALEAAEKADRGTLNRNAKEGLTMRLAQIALAAKEDARAVEYARRTLALAPENPVALQVLALGLLGKNDVRGAVDTFRKLRASPSLDLALAADIDQLLAQLGGA